MAIIVHFSPSGLDKSKYDDAIRPASSKLEQAVHPDVYITAFMTPAGLSR